jgi:hypothetical protein
MYRTLTRPTGTLVMAALFLGFLSLHAGAQEKKPEKLNLTFTGMLAQVTGPAAGAAGIIQVTIDRWSTPEERKAYLEALIAGRNERSTEGKQQKLLNMMEDSRGNKRNGFVRFPRTLGWDLTYAWEFMDGDTRVIRLGTNRPVAFVEAAGDFRTMDYPFGFIELRVKPNGEGEGLIYEAASLTIKNNHLDIESYGIGPQRILSVHEDKKK